MLKIGDLFFMSGSKFLVIDQKNSTYNSHYDLLNLDTFDFLKDRVVRSFIKISGSNGEN